ncbi:MAG: HU family DNA-binding protein [Parabacteroides sp.]|nr:HU family DNA-binding protein [Parabacteroides sp.]
MSAKYKLILRKDMRKDAAADAKLYYASANTTGACDVYELCDLISAQSTASSGDVKLILDELVNVMCRSLGKGEVVKVGELGSFQLQFGSTGTLTEKEFNQALIKDRRIVFRPGKLLKEAVKNYTFEKITVETPSTPSGGGEEERPGEL